jgi:hypothetical protein
VHVRVHSAEAFWQGEPVSRRVGSSLRGLLAESDRARSSGGAARGGYVDPAGQYPSNVHQLLRGLSRQVGSFYSCDLAICPALPGVLMWSR